MRAAEAGAVAIEESEVARSAGRDAARRLMRAQRRPSATCCVELEVSTGGVIRLETDGALFDPEAAGAPDLAAFNAALMLARSFDPRLTPARDRGSSMRA